MAIDRGPQCPLLFLKVINRLCVSYLVCTDDVLGKASILI